MDILQHEIILLCPLSLYTKIADEVNRINLPCQPSSCGHCLNELLTSHFFIPGLKTSFFANPSHCSPEALICYTLLCYAAVIPRKRQSLKLSQELKCKNTHIYCRA